MSDLSKLHIGFFEIKGWEEEFFKSHLPNDELYFSKLPIQDVDLSQISNLDIITCHTASKLDETTISKFPNLKLIAPRVTGYDNIDLNSAQSKNVLVCNVPRYGEHTVAEYTFALLLAVSRKIIDASNITKSTKHFDTTTLQGFDLKDKTIGVVGTGHIGAHVIKIAKGFEMKVIAFDVYPNNEISRSLGFEYVPLETLLRSADIISLHVPYLPETHHLINLGNISQIKKGAVLINTARGAVVETEALLKALTEGILFGAALDVVEEEKLFEGNSAENETQEKNHQMNLQIMAMKNVIITPHNAFNTREALQRIVEETLKNIEMFRSGTPQNVVKPR